MRKNRPGHHREHAELDITGLLNIMIVLVPVLLMSLVFSQITVLNLKLPEGGAGGSGELQNEEVELVIRSEFMEVRFGRDRPPIKTVNNLPDGSRDFSTLSLVFQDLKKALTEKSIDKKSITILSEPDTPYQTLISAVDVTRSYKAVVAANVVDAELFPEVAFGDAPIAEASADVPAAATGVKP